MMEVVAAAVGRGAVVVTRVVWASGSGGECVVEMAWRWWLWVRRLVAPEFGWKVGDGAGKLEREERKISGSESRPPMLNIENHVPWSSRPLRYAKSRPNRKLIHNSILNGPYVRKIEADDQAIQTILLGLPEDIYVAVDSCETAQEIWLRVQKMKKGSDIGNQEKKAKQYVGQNARNPAGYNDVIGNQVIQNVVQNLRVQNVGNQNGLIGVHGNGNQNQNRNGIQLQAEEYDLMAATADLDEIEEVNANCILMANLQQASTSGTQTDSAPVYDTDGSAENDNDVISANTSVEQGGETVEQHPANFEETCALYESLYQNLATEVEKVNSVKSTILTLQHVVKQRMTIETHNWASSAHQELHKIVREEIFPIVNQVDARVQNFEIQFLKEAAKFFRDIKSLANEADASLAKHKALELEIERLLKAVVSQDIMIIVQNESVVDTSDLQTELEHTKERFENYIIKKETKYAKLW
nr:hypothetical protein [Tanacetum cinerariifolium]